MYRKKDGRASPIRLGAKKLAVYTDTTSASDRDYRYYVTAACRRANRLSDVRRALQ